MIRSRDLESRIELARTIYGQIKAVEGIQSDSTEMSFGDVQERAAVAMTEWESLDEDQQLPYMSAAFHLQYKFDIFPRGNNHVWTRENAKVVNSE